MKYDSRYYLPLVLCLKINNSLFCLDLYLHNCTVSFLWIISLGHRPLPFFIWWKNVIPDCVRLYVMWILAALKVFQPARNTASSESLPLSSLGKQPPPLGDLQLKSSTPDSWSLLAERSGSELFRLSCVKIRAESSSPWEGLRDGNDFRSLLYSWGVLAKLLLEVYSPNCLLWSCCLLLTLLLPDCDFWRFANLWNKENRIYHVDTFRAQKSCCMSLLFFSLNKLSEPNPLFKTDYLLLRSVRRGQFFTNQCWITAFFWATIPSELQKD